MRLFVVVLVSLLMGTATGTALTWSRFGRPPERMLPAADVRVDEDAPRLVILDEKHDFGNIEQGATVRHAFAVRNVGRGMLKLRAGDTSCGSCTIAELVKEEVAPGESTEVVVEYRATTPASFRQTANLFTNDPAQSRVELTIVGKVTAKFDILPLEMQFGNVSVGETATAQVEIVRFIDTEFDVVAPEIVDGGAGELFDLRVEPLAESDLKDGALGGYRLLATLKPGLPLGPFRRTIRVTLQFGSEGERAERQVPLAGTIVSDVSIVGADWRGDAGVLLLGNVRSAQGARRELMLLVRGKHREEIVITPRETDPSWLRVTLGERKKLNAAVDQIPLVVEVPPGSPPSIHLGTDQGALGTIVLGVENYPDLSEIRMRVRFIVE